ncbi:helix-loop-helix dna-binding domain-containing protein [Colletotrichum truncatum]|uniref:Helix-loop-helix dna-binding domain-containing protein n=1 Tax=Colletotrichum truncatum TaxID=5467 RepID=A0ACC3YQP5_COLTU|nr:helix-loop-helix dna-binding domain-containing protein [Colletotrichum truncatum]KAF6798967.1 helix-loop-helix dna-binding domain-containing protein [Colletotrichum truncatum]
MDPNFLKNLDYFAVPNNQTNSSVEQSAESSASGAARNAPETSMWEALGADQANSESTSNGPSGSLPSFAQASPVSTNFGLGSMPGQIPYGQGQPRNALPTRMAQTAGPRRRDGHDRKRTKVDSEAAALESVDYWIQFDDDDEQKLGGSFEIDFSKRRHPIQTYPRAPAANRLNPMSTTPGLGAGLYTNPVFKPEDFLDDTALDNALSDDEDVLESMSLGDQLGKIESQPPSEVPPREGLYSTPLSWEKPAPGLRMNPLFGMGAMGGMGTPMLDPEQRRLLAIALNTGRSSTSIASGMGFGVGADLGPEFSSLENFDASMATTSMSELTRGPEQSSLQNKGKEKEKASTEKDSQSQRPQVSRTTTAGTGASEKSKDKLKAGDRTAHNDIERKYRTNLKDKISELRDAVPSLRSIPEEGGEDVEVDSQSQRGPKVSKGTVLTKATEYIHYLERRNKAIMREHQELARRLQAFEQLLSATARQPFPMPNYSRTLFDPRGFC